MRCHHFAPETVLCGKEVCARSAVTRNWDFRRCRVEGTQSPPLIEPDRQFSRIRLSEVVHRNGYRVHATVEGIFQS